MPDTVPSALEFFFFNDPATTEIYTLSLHDALPISANGVAAALSPDPGDYRHHRGGEDNGDAHLKNLLVHHQVVLPIDRKSTRLNSSHANISYAVFCLKKKTKTLASNTSRLQSCQTF